MSRLHITYRPDKLSDVIGNQTTIKSIQTQLESDDPPRAWLFQGSAGCGKTTLGRIVGKALGAGEHDLYEVDTADYRGIDQIREIRRRMILAPSKTGGRRCWILDECHKLTKDAQNALLKALEDTPRHVVFILCTTNPEALIGTIKSRCSAYTVGPLRTKQMVKLLKIVCHREKKKVPLETLKTIAERSLGTPRDALVALGQVIELPVDEMQKAAESFKAVTEATEDLAKLLLSKDVTWGKVAQAIKAIDDDPNNIRFRLAHYMSAIILNNAPSKVKAAVILDRLGGDWLFGKPDLVITCYDICAGLDVPY